MNTKTIHIPYFSLYYRTEFLTSFATLPLAALIFAFLPLPQNAYPSLHTDSCLYFEGIFFCFLGRGRKWIHKLRHSFLCLWSINLQLFQRNHFYVWHSFSFIATFVACEEALGSAFNCLLKDFIIRGLSQARFLVWRWM